MARPGELEVLLLNKEKGDPDTKKNIERRAQEGGRKRCRRAERPGGGDQQQEKRDADDPAERSLVVGYRVNRLRGMGPRLGRRREIGDGGQCAADSEDDVIERSVFLCGCGRIALS